MIKMRVTYDVQQPFRDIEVSEETAKYLDRRKDGSYSYAEGSRERAVEEIISKLQEFHPGQRLEVVDVQRV